MQLPLPLINPVPAKPADGEACNGCGVCCLTQQCRVAQVLGLPVIGGKCAALVWREGRYWCEVLLEDPHPGESNVSLWLGMGWGCGSDDLLLEDPRMAGN